MPQQQLITSSNYSPLVEVLVWLLLALTIVSVCGREAIKLWVLRKMAMDDAVILLSLLASIVQSATMLIAVNNGFGQHAKDLSTETLDHQEQARYAADIVLIPGLFFAKAALLLVVHSLSPKRSHKLTSWAVGAFILGWALISIFLTAFRCAIPSPWQEVGKTCIDYSTALDIIATINLGTEVALVVLPCMIVLGLQIPIAKKMPLLATFLSRALIIAAIICQLAFVNQVESDGDNSFALWPTAICTQIVQCLTIVAACLVYLRPFLDSAESGFIRVDDARRRGEASTYARGTLDHSQKSTDSTQPPVSRSNFSASQLAYELKDLSREGGPEDGCPACTCDEGGMRETGYSPPQITQTRSYTVAYR